MGVKAASVGVKAASVDEWIASVDSISGMHRDSLYAIIMRVIAPDD